MSRRVPPRRAEPVRPGQVWTGKGALLGRVIRVTRVSDSGMVSFEVLSGSRTSRPIRELSLRAGYIMRSDPRHNPVAVNGEELTEVEGQVIASLQRLADRWPATLKVALVNGELRVLHSGSPVQDESVLEVIRGIPGE